MTTSKLSRHLLLVVSVTVLSACGPEFGNRSKGIDGGAAELRPAQRDIGAGTQSDTGAMAGDTATGGSDVAIVSADVAAGGGDVAVGTDDTAAGGSDSAIVAADAAAGGSGVTVGTGDAAVGGGDVAVVTADTAVGGGDVAVGTGDAAATADASAGAPDAAVAAADGPAVGADAATSQPDVATPIPDLGSGDLPSLGTTEVIIQDGAEGFCAFDGTRFVVGTTSITGFTGGGYADSDPGVGVGMNWGVRSERAGIAKISWRYAFGGIATNLRDGKLIVNGLVIANPVVFPYTTDWSTWVESQPIAIPLRAGSNHIRLEAVTNGGLGNIDWVKLVGDGLTPDSPSCSITALNQEIPDISARLCTTRMPT